MRQKIAQELEGFPVLRREIHWDIKQALYSLQQEGKATVLIGRTHRALYTPSPNSDSETWYYSCTILNKSSRDRLKSLLGEDIKYKCFNTCHRLH